MTAGPVCWKRPKKKKKKKPGENNFHCRPQWRQNKQPEKKWQLFPFPTWSSTAWNRNCALLWGRWAKMSSIMGMAAPDQSQTTTWWVSSLGRQGDLFKERGSREGARETRRRYAKEGGEKNKMENLLTHCNHRAELLLLLPPLLGVELAASPSEGQSDASHQLWRAIRLRVGNRMEK